MSVAKVTEISASSPNSFDDAVKVGIARASQTLKGIKSAWVNEMNVDVQDGQVTAYRVNMKITFILND
jgi:flavin-binding protein dodecin